MNPIDAAFAEHAAVLAEADGLRPVLLEVAQLIGTRLRAGGSLVAFGNGGSAADAQHLAAELVGRFRVDRKGWPAFALTADGAALTAISNDYGFDQVFERQVLASVRPGDVAVAISVSGRSRNVILGARAARSLGAAVVVLTGAGPTTLADEADLVVAVPCTTVARVQELHGLCLHAVVAHLDANVPEARS